jgi:hypothetical protein
MNRKLSPSGRAAALARRELDAFPVIEGRDPTGADLDAIVKRTVECMVPIFKREQATDIVYDELEKRRAERIAKRRAEVRQIDRPETDIIKVSGGAASQQAKDTSVTKAEDRGEFGPALAQLGPEARSERIRSQKWSSPSDDADYLKSLEKYDGRKVRLPDGSLVPDRYSPTDSLMSPVEDLRRVARAGRAAGFAMKEQGIAVAAFTPENLHRHYEQVFVVVRSAIGQGGEFDYQRKAAIGGKDGFVQLRQFRNVSNFNVGLFMQQAGFELWQTLAIAGGYAWKNSSNFRPDEPYGLDPQTREFIELGYRTGRRGVFN